MNRKVRLMWNKISPLSIGTHVRFVKDDPPFRDMEDRKFRKSHTGIITEYVDQGWKEYMVNGVHCYPPEILHETLYVVRYKERGTGYAMRITELEVVEDGF